jgi:hypothetical protein
MRRYRYLGTSWTKTRLFAENPELNIQREDIQKLKVRDSIAVMPRMSTKAYMVTRIK